MIKTWIKGSTTTRVRILSGLLALLHLLPAAAQTNTPLPEWPDLDIPLWHKEVQLRGGLGYKDNIMLSSVAPESSPFWSSHLEALLFRLPTGRWGFHAFVDATDIRYSDAPDIDNEQLIMAAAEVSRNLGKDWNSTLGLSYLFQNGVYDFSTTYTNAAAIGQIVGHTLTPRWSVRKELAPFWVETELNATRQLLESPLDDYWQSGPRAAVGRALGARGEISLSYQWSWLAYDNREQVNAQGFAVTNTSLAFQSHLIEGTWTQSWGEQERWRTSTRAGAELNEDNGSGYYDYTCYRFLQELRYRDGKWEARVRFRLSQYEYPNQAVSATDGSNRERTRIAITVSAERALSKHFRLFANYSWENSDSNLSFNNYQANVVVGGLAAIF